MVTPNPGPRGGFNIVTHPKHFRSGSRVNMVKQVASEIKMLDDVTHGPESSPPFSVNNTRRFTVFCTGTLAVDVETSITPLDVSSFQSIGSVTVGNPLEVSAYYGSIRVITTGGTGDAILLRDYKDGSQ